MDKKTFVPYNRLVVPSAMRSIYWKYFGFPAADSGDILTKVKIVCLLCKSQISYNKNTSNLRMHLHNKHSVELAELEANNNSSPTPKKLPKASRKNKTTHNNTSTLTMMNNNFHESTSIDGGLYLNESNLHLISTEEGSTEYPGHSSANNVRIILKTDSQLIDPKGNLPTTSTTKISIPSTNRMETIQLHEKTLWEQFVNFLIQELQSPDLINEPGFQIFLSICNESRTLILPKKTKIYDEIIPKCYDQCKHNVQNIIAEIQNSVSLTFEEWEHCTGERYVTISVYYMNENSLKSNVLETVHASKQLDMLQWTHYLDSILLEYDINIEKISAIVYATQQKALLEAIREKGIQMLPCIMYTLQLCANACFQHPEINTILIKCRATIELISKYNVAKEELRLQEQMCEIEEWPLLLDIPSVWMSTYMMLEQFHERRHYIYPALENIVNLEHDLFLLDDHQWNIIEDLLNVLRPLKVTILTLSEEKSLLASLLKPLNFRLNETHLKVESEDSVITKFLKKNISTILYERYQNDEVADFLKISTLLDPRFKFNWSEDDSNIHEMFKNILINFLKEDLSSSTTTPTTTNQDNNNMNPKKKIRISGIEFLFGNIRLQQSIKTNNEEKMQLELTQYESEPNASLEECPLKCWQKLDAKCPSMSRMANKYLCVPPSVILSKRIPHDIQINFNIKRSKIPSNLIDKMLFLHNNYIIS